MLRHVTNAASVQGDSDSMSSEPLCVCVCVCVRFLVWINSAGGFKTNSITFRNQDIYYAHLYEYVRVNLSIGK